MRNNLDKKIKRKAVASFKSTNFTKEKKRLWICSISKGSKNINNNIYLMLDWKGKKMV